MIQNPTYLIWIDLEMTGLDTLNDQIIEIATVITTGSLDTVAEGPVIAIHQPDHVINAMDEWNRVTHGDSGLIRRIRESSYTHAEAEREDTRVHTLQLRQRDHDGQNQRRCGDVSHCVGDQRTEDADASQ